MQRALALGLCILLLMVGCAPTAPQTPESSQITIFAASSLSDAFNEIATAYEGQHPGVDVVLNFGSSSQLATQINEGAPADLFASANARQMQVVQDAGHIEGTPAIFVTNRLVVIVPSANPGGVAELSDLAKPGLRIVLAAPGVPIRDYADQMLAALAADPAYGQEYADAVYANVVSEEENVRQVVAKVSIGEADAAVVYASDVTPDVMSQITQIEVPDAYNVLASYPIATVKESAQPALAQAFIDYALSEEGQGILTHWGFGAAPGE